MDVRARLPLYFLPFSHLINPDTSWTDIQVTAATQPSFLQHAVHLDMPHKRLHVLGEVNKRFVVSPNVDALLADVERADEQGSGIDFGEDGLLRMDET